MYHCVKHYETASVYELCLTLPWLWWWRVMHLHSFSLFYLGTCYLHSGVNNAICARCGIVNVAIYPLMISIMAETSTQLFLAKNAGRTANVYIILFLIFSSFQTLIMFVFL